MKLRLCTEILKNFGRLISFDFLKAVIKNPDFPVFQIIWITVFVAFADVIKMPCIPNYPTEPEATE